MLLILQAPAYDNDTLTIVINRFMAISYHIPFHTTWARSITANQPIYHRGKELMWANSKFESVNFLMGGLHICFNFLKSIGQHMDSTGLDYLWTDVGVYVANTTQTMLDGKAYYLAVRRHQLKYEALWLTEYGHKHEMTVEEFAQVVGQVLKKQKNPDHRGAKCCTAIDQLSDAFRSVQVESLMEEFD